MKESKVGNKLFVSFRFKIPVSHTVSSHPPVPNPYARPVMLLMMVHTLLVEWEGTLTL